MFDRDRICEWCRGPIRPAARSDAKVCSKRCRQAKARFRVAPAGVTTDRPAHFGYADPPYPGLAWKYYRMPEVNHPILIGTLERDYPDGWALSTSAEALPKVLAMCPAGVRVACWARGARPGKSMRPRAAWEPLIVRGGRVSLKGVPEGVTDTLIGGGRQRSHPGALIGMKSAAYCTWMFQQLGAAVGDELDDIFPGSGAVGRAWQMHARSERDT